METKFMKTALRLAKKAAAADEVPVGAVIVRDGRIIATGYNRKEKTGNALKHAEMIAIERAIKKVGDWRLNDCEMYVTLEPCAMCAGAMVNSRIGRLYFGAYDPKGGCCGSLYDIPSDARLNHRFEATGGIMEEECGRVLSEFFRKKRREKAE